MGWRLPLKSRFFVLGPRLRVVLRRGPKFNYITSASFLSSEIYNKNKQNLIPKFV